MELVRECANCKKDIAEEQIFTEITLHMFGVVKSSCLCGLCTAQMMKDQIMKTGRKAE